MNVRPRLLVSSFVSAKTCKFKNTKPSTHYETLEVNHRATQSEIKAAYFKLSKQYHPDKNSSDAATVKFREVAAAYEILGNFNSRRSYDRSILTRTEHIVPKKGATPEDPNIKYYQSQAALYRTNTKTGSTPIYDFDAWTKAHYSHTLHRNLKDATTASQRREERAQYTTPNPVTKDAGFMVFAFIFITVLVLLGANTKTEHDQALTIRQRNELEFRNQSQTNLEESSVDLLSSK